MEGSGSLDPRSRLSRTPFPDRQTPVHGRRERPFRIVRPPFTAAADALFGWSDPRSRLPRTPFSDRQTPVHGRRERPFQIIRPRSRLPRTPFSDCQTSFTAAVKGFLGTFLAFAAAANGTLGKFLAFAAGAKALSGERDRLHGRRPAVLGE